MTGLSARTRGKEDEVEHQAHHGHPGVGCGAVVVSPRQLPRQLAGVAAAAGGGPGVVVGGWQAGGVGHGVVQVDVAVAAVQVLATVVAGSAQSKQARDGSGKNRQNASKGQHRHTRELISARNTL